MRAKSKSSSAAIDRPFDGRLRARARSIAEQYQVILRREGREWYGRGLELPHVFAGGSTSAKCIAATCEALTAAVALLLEQHQAPPAPAREGARTVQVNVRLSAEEKLLLETTAKSKGFQGLSDFVRHAALESAK